MSADRVEQVATSLRQMDAQHLLRRTRWYLERLIPVLSSQTEQDPVQAFPVAQVNTDRERLEQLARVLEDLDVGLPFAWLIVRKRGLDPAEVFAFSTYAEAAGHWHDAQGEGFSTYLCQVVARDGGPAEHA
jgi:hypothetical protein